MLFCLLVDLYQFFKASLQLVLNNFLQTSQIVSGKWRALTTWQLIGGVRIRFGCLASYLTRDYLFDEVQQ